MAAESSSPRKPTKKAGSHDRSTTFSTTGMDGVPDKSRKSDEQVSGETTSESAGESETSTEAVVLTRNEQRELLKTLQAGGSPLVACNKLGVLLDSYDLTCQRDTRFRARLERLYQALDENVDAAIYRDALTGSASAQANWKKHQAEVDGEVLPGEARLREMSTEALLAYQLRLRRLGGNDSSSEAV
jgi:hypothetical protein